MNLNTGRDRSMLVLYLPFHGCQQCCQFVCAFKLLSDLSRTPALSNALGVPIIIVRTPCCWISSSKNPSEFQKAAHGIGVNISWNHPFSQWVCHAGVVTLGCFSLNISLLDEFYC